MESNQDLLTSFIEISIEDPSKFLIIKETLTRIGTTSKTSKTLNQSCHILNKRGKLYIVHFKEMFLLDGKQSSFDDNDRARRNTIAKLLEQWGLLKIVNPQVAEETVSIKQMKIIPYSEKDEWELKPMYTIGKIRHGDKPRQVSYE